MKRTAAVMLMLYLALFVAVTVNAQSPQTPPPAPPAYGTPITLEQAKKVLAGAEAEAKKNNWNVVIAVLSFFGLR